MGLIGTVIGAGAVLLGQALEARRQAKAEAQREHKLAVEEVLVRSQAVDLLAHEMVLLAANLGSISGFFSRAIGAVSPVDFLAVFERMNNEATAMQRAASQVWLFADERPVSLSNAVVIAAAEVMNAHQAHSTGSIRRYTTVLVVGRHPSDAARLGDARAALSEARRALILHTRTCLDLPEADPYSVLDPTLSQAAH